MGLELASFLLALGFYLLFLLSFLCPLGEKNGGETGPYPVEEEDGSQKYHCFYFSSVFSCLLSFRTRQLLSLRKIEE